MSNEKRVTAIFENRNKALAAINKLETMGYSKESLTLLVAENSWNKENLKIDTNTKASEGTAVGAGLGAAAGAVAAGLTAVGTIAATGGLGLLATGPIVAALAGAGAGGATGGIVGGLIGLGFTEVEAKYVDDELGRGSVMIGVQTDSDKYSEVKDSLDKMSPNKVTVH